MVRFGCGIRTKTPGTVPKTGTSPVLATPTVFRFTPTTSEAQKKIIIKVQNSPACQA